MRTTLLTLTALAGLFGAGAASAAPRLDVPQSFVQTVQYYGGAERAEYYGDRDWRGREEWRHREWERHRRMEEWRRAHRGYERY